MYIYVIEFNNGLIKVGQTTDVAKRIAQHADRLIVGGVHLLASKSFICSGNVFVTEIVILKKCKELAKKTIKREWFFGLDFKYVCEVANNECAKKHEKKIKVIKEKVIDPEQSAIGLLIDALGGPAELSRALSAKEVKSGRKEISRQTVQGWKKRGIPARIQLRYKSYFGKL